MEQLKGFKSKYGKVVAHQLSLLEQEATVRLGCRVRKRMRMEQLKGGNTKYGFYGFSSCSSVVLAQARGIRNTGAAREKSDAKIEATESKASNGLGAWRHQKNLLQVLHEEVKMEAKLVGPFWGLVTA
jgi:hypothetical protein